MTARARGRRRAALAIALATLVASCARHEDPSTNLVLIGIDTLRADHVGCYGYRRPTSPHIDALARDGVLFTTAVSQAPWTLPAFASILTGLLPSHHRAGEGKLPYVSALGPDADTLAATLARQGFVTAGFVSNVWVGADTGLDRGFGTHRMSQQPAEAVDGAIAWLGSKPAGRFFLFVHIYDPHAPYTPPDEDAAPFVAAGYEGRFQHQFPAVWKNGVPDMAVDPRWSSATASGSSTSMTARSTTPIGSWGGSSRRSIACTSPTTRSSSSSRITARSSSTTGGSVTATRSTTSSCACRSCCASRRRACAAASRDRCGAWISSRRCSRRSACRCPLASTA